VASAKLTVFNMSAHFNIISYNKPHLHSPSLGVPSHVGAWLSRLLSK